MISYTIPDFLEFKLYKQKSDSYILKLSNEKTCTWFRISGEDFSLKGRVFIGSKKTIKCLKRGVKTLLLGYKRSLTLHGVGYKGFLSEDKDYLLIKVSNAKPSAFKIPKDIVLDIHRNTVSCWSYNVNIIDNFFKRIILKTPAPKNYIKWS